MRLHVLIMTIIAKILWLMTVCATCMMFVFALGFLLGNKRQKRYRN